jgi:copper chaperone CopZ
MRSASLAVLLAGAGASHIPSCPAPASTECLLDALRTHGAVAMSNVPGVKAAREAAFRSVAKCESGEAAPESMSEVALADGTVRRSLGTRTVRGVPEQLDSACADPDGSMETLRTLVDTASRRFLGALNLAVPDDEAILNTRTARAYHSLADVAQGGEQLEHFHVYKPEAAPHAAATPPALPLHTDAGLFIALVPAMWVDLARPSPASEPTDGFYVQAVDGTHLTISPQDAPSSVVFVMGDGWAKWIEPSLRSGFRAAPHAMVVTAPPPTDAGASLLRLWYGRMFLPPNDALMPLSGRSSANSITYGEWAAWAKTSSLSPAGDAAHAEASSLLPTGCGGHQRSLAVFDADGCNENQVLCWHVCESIESLPCGKDNAVCQDASSGDIWTRDDTHCTGCTAACEAMPPPPSPSPGAAEGPPRNADEPLFCTGPGTAMHMDGFTFVSYGESNCVILLFNSWRIGTASAFAIAFIGIVLMGILTEALTAFRRTTIPRSTFLNQRPRTRKVAMGLLYSVQVVLGYLLMLIAMTYQVELFIAVILGLGLGHTVLNTSAPVPETSDPCCVPPVPPTAITASMPLKTIATDAGDFKPSTYAAGKPAGPPYRCVVRAAPVSCEGCCAVICSALRSLDGVTSCSASLDGTVQVEMSVDLPPSELIRARAIERTGKTATLALLAIGVRQEDNV